MHFVRPFNFIKDVCSHMYLGHHLAPSSLHHGNENPYHDPSNLHHDLYSNICLHLDLDNFWGNCLLDFFIKFNSSLYKDSKCESSVFTPLTKSISYDSWTTTHNMFWKISIWVIILDIVLIPVLVLFYLIINHLESWRRRPMHLSIESSFIFVIPSRRAETIPNGCYIISLWKSWSLTPFFTKSLLWLNDCNNIQIRSSWVRQWSNNFLNLSHVSLIAYLPNV